MRRCLDEGTIQSYLDGELSPEEFAQAEAHVASCAACASASREAAEEFSAFLRAFADESAIPVPSERLRERVETAVAGLQASQARESFKATQEKWSVRRWLASLAEGFALTPARAAAFAGLAAVVALGVVFAVVRSQMKQPSNQEIAKVVNDPAPDRKQRTTDTNEESKSQETELNNKSDVTPAEDDEGDTNKTNQPRAPRRQFRPRARPDRSPIVSPLETALPGEDKYVQSIASLKKTVDAVGNVIMQPSVRAQYERNLAVVDQAIEVSRRNALRNPKDREAARFLFSAYESKIELMSAIVGQAQVAAVGR